MGSTVEKETVKASKVPKAPATMPKAVMDILNHFVLYVQGRSPEYPETLTTLPAFIDKREAHEGRQADCTVYVGSAVMCLTSSVHVWTLADYRDLMLMDGSKPWSATEAWGRATGAPVVSGGAIPIGEVHAVQGLSGLCNGVFGRGTRGHQWVEFNGLAWHMSIMGKGPIMGGTIPSYEMRKSVRIC